MSDDICQARGSTELVPHSLPETHPPCRMGGQNSKYAHNAQDQNVQHPRSPLPEQFPLARLRLPYASRSHTKRHPILLARTWIPAYWETALRFKNVCKGDLKAASLNTDQWEELARNRSKQEQLALLCTRFSCERRRDLSRSMSWKASAETAAAR